MAIINSVNIETLYFASFKIILTNNTNYKFEKKPKNAKTLKQLLSENLKPKDINSLEYFIMPSRSDMAYVYIREENAISLTDDEIDWIETYKNNKQIKKQEKIKENKIEKKQTKRELLLKEAAKYYNKNIICFDTETTGFSPKIGDELLQLSIVDKNENVLFESYIKPYHKKTWVDAQRVNHISPQMVKDAPYPHEIKNKVLDIFNSADLIIGHNVPYDIRFVEACLQIPMDKYNIQDTLSIYKADYNSIKGKSYSLENAVKDYCPNKIENHLSGAHNSTTDTKSTMAVFLAQAKKGLEMCNDFKKEDTNNFLNNKEQSKFELDEEDFDISY